MKKEGLFTKKVKRIRKTGFRLLNIGGRIRQDRSDRQEEKQREKL